MQVFDFKRATAFCVGHRFSKHKTERYARIFLGGRPLGLVYVQHRFVIAQ